MTKMNGKRVLPIYLLEIPESLREAGREAVGASKKQARELLMEALQSGDYEIGDGTYTHEPPQYADDYDPLFDEFKRDKIMSVVCVFDGLLRYVINADRGNDLNDILFNAVLDTMEAIVTAALDQAYEYGKEA